MGRRRCRRRRSHRRRLHTHARTKNGPAVVLVARRGGVGTLTKYLLCTLTHARAHAPHTCTQRRSHAQTLGAVCGRHWRWWDPHAYMEPAKCVPRIQHIRIYTGQNDTNTRDYGGAVRWWRGAQGKKARDAHSRGAVHTWLHTAAGLVLAHPEEKRGFFFHLYKYIILDQVFLTEESFLFLLLLFF